MTFIGNGPGGSKRAAATSPVTATAIVTWGVYDLNSGASYINGLVNERRAAYKPMPPYRDAVFTPDAMAGDGVR